MDDRGTPLNQAPVINDKDVDLYKLFKVFDKLMSCNNIICCIQDRIGKVNSQL